MASQFLITSILTQRDLSRLTCLSLTNLYQYSEYQDIPQNLPLKLKSAFLPVPNEVGVQWPVEVGIPGPMHGHLTPCIGKLPNLRMLLVDTVGQAETTYRNGCWDGEAEDERYNELAALIKSVSGTLEHLRFQQGHSGPWEVGEWREINYNAEFRRPPDGRRCSKYRYNRSLPSLTYVYMCPLESGLSIEPRTVLLSYNINV